VLKKLLFFFLIIFSGNQGLLYGQVVANFTASASAGCAPFVVSFTNTSSGATSYSWTFGNTGTSTQTNASTSYLNPGTYTVTLVAKNGTVTNTKSMQITVWPPPVVNFVANDTSVCPGVSVSFLNTSVNNAPGTSTYYWDFGDGYNSNLQNPSHVFPGPGSYNIILKVTNSYGCFTTLTRTAYIRVFTPPVASFTMSTHYICHAPDSVRFTSTASGTPPLTTHWDFGDGQSITANNPLHMYTAPGTYTVKLIVTDSNGCQDSSIVVAALVVGNLTAGFTSTSPVCVFNTVSFLNTTNQNNISSSWDFGDNTGATNNNPTHVYLNSGTYTVRLIVFDGTCYDTIQHTVIVNPQPTSSFTFTPQHPCPPPSGIQFTASGPGGATYSWNFGDQSSGNGQNITHTYNTDGFDTVQMITTNTNGCKDTVTQVVYVYDVLGSQQNLSANPTSGCIPLTIWFSEIPQTNTPNASTPYNYPYPVTNYVWNFGDGSPIVNTTTNPTSHTYTTAGNFHVSVTVTTQNGCTFTDTIDVKAGIHGIVDSLTANPLHICNHSNVDFHAYAHGVNPIDYHWYYGTGDSNVTSSATDIHNYDTPGVFNAYVIISNYGCFTTDTFHVTIRVDSPKVRFSFMQSCDSPLSVKLIAHTLGADSIRWVLGDGYSTTSDTLVHTFPTAGTWTIKLFGYNIASGCVDSAVTSAYLFQLVPNFVANDTAICRDASVTFTSSFTGGPAPTHYLWFINNANADTAQNMVYTFNTTGWYNIKLKIYDIYNCSDTITRNHYILVAKPVDSFYAVPTVGCRPLWVQFIDSSTDVPGAFLVSRFWNFGDGTSGTTAGPDTTHLYSVTGSYDIKTIVTDNLGCKDSLTLSQYINILHPVPAFSASNLFPCPYTNVYFSNTSTGNITGAFWHFGDGDTSSIISPNHIYTDTGIFTVKLVVWDSLGCSDSLTQLAYIHVTRPTANFSVSDTVGICIPMAVQFNNLSLNAQTYTWTFGNGITSTAVNPGSSYLSPGYYPIMLVATNIYGCTDTLIRHINLYGYAGAFTYQPLKGCVPLQVNFSANIQNIPHITWDYSDGNVDTTLSLTKTHTYLVAGAFLPRLILRDSSGCTASSQGLDTIKVDKVTAAFVTHPNPICIHNDATFLDSSSSLFSTVNAWNWVFQNGYTSSDNSVIQHYDTPGTYTLTLIAEDAWGCYDTLAGTISVKGLPTILASRDTVICLGDQAHLLATGGVSYNWSPAIALNCTNCASPLANPTTRITYTVTGYDANGCSNTDTTTVLLKTRTVSYPGKNQTICKGSSVMLQDSAAETYLWIPPSYLNNPQIGNPIATPDTNITYMIVAKQGSCSPDTEFVSVKVLPRPTVDAGPDVTIIDNETTVLHATGSLIKYFSWSPTAGLSCDSCSTPTVKIPKTTTFTVTVFSSFGCEDSDKVTVNVVCDKGQVFVPNSFTPNGDGQNDVFYPRGVGINKIVSFRVFDRWGEMVFERTNIALNDEGNAWDGTYKGNKPRPDVYVYTIDAICESGEELFFKGDVTIIR
jgi:gliding motility-associated-like protein